MDSKQLKKAVGLVLMILLGGTSVIPTSISQAETSPKRFVVCYRGKTLLVPEASLQSYIDRGATIGACVVTECQNR